MVVTVAERVAAFALIVALAAAGQAALAADVPPARGQALFEKRCGVCHLQGQTGTTILARRLGKEKSLLAGRTDLQPEYIRIVVRRGLVNMPRLTRVELPDADLDAIAGYLTRVRPTAP